jgi:hypothetical protein
MKEHVVYILGAGFSRPLDLPLVSDFLFKAKDLYWKDTTRYKHFVEVFQKIERLAQIKTYYESDQLNIEELLSILTMSSAIQAKDDADTFSKFITDVIEAYTPFDKEVGTAEISPVNFQGGMFSYPKYKPYLWFLSNILGLEFFPVHYSLSRTNYLAQCRVCEDTEYTYDVVSMNYDMILENALAHINKFYVSNEQQLHLNRSWKSDLKLGGNLAKLHGSVDDKLVIPPTWNKSVTPGKILEAWQIARYSLSEANHIRIIGYSLPRTDSYIKYLLKEAIINAQSSHNLKSLDIICYDPAETVMSNYRDFIKFREARFVSQKIENYFSNDNLSRMCRNKSSENKNLIADGLQNLHLAFMQQNGGGESLN